MVDSLAALVLAAGKGRRLRPLSAVRPKALCPVANDALVDLAISRVLPLVRPGAVAVNVHAGRPQMEAHLAGRVHLSLEEPVALGTAGAVAYLRPWLDGRPVLVVNADAWHQADLASLIEGWDGSQVRVLVAGEATLGPRSRILGSLLPPSAIAPLPHEPSGLWEVCWRVHLSKGTLEVVGSTAPFVDCGTPRAYLSANLAASGGCSVVGEGATVLGSLERSVVWPGATVYPGERLVDAIRVGDGMTVLVR